MLVGAGDSHASFPAAHGRLLINTESRDFDATGLTLLPANKQDRVAEFLFAAGVKGEGSMSPDGTRMAAKVTTLGQHPQIAVLSLFFEGDVITEDASSKGRPAWSPDGTQLVYASNKSGKWDIYVMAANGSGSPVDLTAGSGANNWNPRWSPDGGTIAFESSRAGPVDIFTMKPNGTDVRDITTDPGEDRLGDWSPDSKKIVFTSTRGGDRELYTMNADGSGATRLANDHGDDFNPVFAPDGSTVAFSSARDGDSDVYLIASAGGTETKLTHNATEDIVQDWQPLVDASPPVTRALPGHGKRGKPLRLRYQVSENSGTAELHIDGTYRNGGFGGDFSPRTYVPGKTYLFVLPAFIVRHLPRVFTFCVTASDPSANESNRSCAKFHIRHKRRKRAKAAAIIASWRTDKQRWFSWASASSRARTRSTRSSPSPRVSAGAVSARASGSKGSPSRLSPLVRSGRFCSRWGWTPPPLVSCSKVRSTSRSAS
jgi:dipeptidyl aminopeptidase/acylaminoacyl peptidase